MGLYAAEPSAAPVKSVNPVEQVNITQWIVGLLAVLALIFIAAWLARRFGQFHTAGAGQLQILGGLSVGTREKIVLLKAGGRHLLVGVAPNQVNTLHVFETNEISDGVPAGAEQKPFAEYLRSSLGGGNKG